jgi:hypothetical protein
VSLSIYIIGISGNPIIFRSFSWPFAGGSFSWPFAGGSLQGIVYVGVWWALLCHTNFIRVIRKVLNAKGMNIWVGFVFLPSLRPIRLRLKSLDLCKAQSKMAVGHNHELLLKK